MNYDFELKYHASKANVVVDALSRKSLHMFLMMIEEHKLLEKFRDLNISVSLKPHCLYASKLRIQCDLKDQIRQTLETDKFLKSPKSRFQIEQIEHFHIDEKGAVTYKGSLCVPNNEELRNNILSEVYCSKFTYILVQPRCIKTLGSCFGGMG